MSNVPLRRPRSTGPMRAGAAGRAGRGKGRAGRGGTGNSRPAAGRPGAAPAGAPTHTRRSRAAAGPAGSSSTPRRFRSTLLRQVTVLGLVCCAVALVLAFPFRSYLAQKADLNQQVVNEKQLQDQLAALDEQQTALTDPAYIKLEARRRLQYVQPGDTVFTVYAPAQAAPANGTHAATGAGSPWYVNLWHTLSDPGPARAQTGQ